MVHINYSLWSHYLSTYTFTQTHAPTNIYILHSTNIQSHTQSHTHTYSHTNKTHTHYFSLVDFNFAVGTFAFSILLGIWISVWFLFKNASTWFMCVNDCQVKIQHNHFVPLYIQVQKIFVPGNFHFKVFHNLNSFDQFQLKVLTWVIHFSCHISNCMVIIIMMMYWKSNDAWSYVL